MKKRIYGYMVALFLLCTYTLTIYAANEYTEGYFKYRIKDSGVIICEYFGSEAEVFVPASIAGNPVNVIAQGAFLEESGVKKVNLPDSIMTVERNAFGKGIQVVYNSNTDVPVESGKNQIEDTQDSNREHKTEISKENSMSETHLSNKEKEKSKINQSETIKIINEKEESLENSDIDSDNEQNTEMSDENTVKVNDESIDEVDLDLESAFPDSEEKENKDKKKHKGIIILGIILLVIGSGVFFCYRWKKTKR